MYFGTMERMTWIECPDVGVDIVPNIWSVSANLLNGGFHARRSQASGMGYSLTWTNINTRGKQTIEDYFAGAYGPGPFYFIVPGTYQNVLPHLWATPRVAALDGISLLKGQPPRLVSMPDTNGYPTASAHYVVEEADERHEIIVPVPEGITAGIGWHGGSTGGTAVAYTVDGGPEVRLYPMSRTPSMTNTDVKGPVTLRLRIAEGTGSCTINALAVQFRKPGAAPTTDGFYGGMGHSGAGFMSLEPKLISSANDQWTVTASFQEVGSWL